MYVDDVAGRCIASLRSRLQAQTHTQTDRQTDRRTGNNAVFSLLMCAERIAVKADSLVSQPFSGHIETTEQRAVIQQYGDWYIGR